MIVFEINENIISFIRGKAKMGSFEPESIFSGQANSDKVEELGELISQAMMENKLKNKEKVVLSIPRNQVAMRFLKLPSQDEEELKSIIELQITQEVPYPREDIIYNFEVIEKEKGFSTIVLSIIHRQMLLKQFALLERENIYPSNIILSTASVMKTLEKTGSLDPKGSGIGICIDICSSYSDIFVFRGKKLLLSKSTEFGSKDSNDPSKRETFLSELRQVVTLSPLLRQEGPDKLLVASKAVKGSNLGRELEEVFDMPVEEVDLNALLPGLSELTVAGNTGDSIGMASLLGAAIDPGTKNFTFSLPEAETRKDMKEFLDTGIRAGIMLVYAVLLLLVFFVGRMYMYQSYLDKLDKEIADLEFKNKTQIVQVEKIKEVKKFTSYEDSLLRYYYDLSALVPKNITVSRIMFSHKKEFSIIGEGADMGAIFKFVSILNSSNKYGTVELRYSRKKTKGTTEYNEFDIMCHII
ncbi:MAG: pilus assembly protein PilM [Candidatus Omnitrophica bacterium]|nr:pilus assembly protein PilM [Candidatus Omnitrophota bacterium]